MRPISTAQSFDESQMLSMDETPSRPPDAAIRANSEIIQRAMKITAMAMAANASIGGLNIVVSGNNPGVARPPEKISGENGALLAATTALDTGIAAAAHNSERPSASEEPAAEKPAANAPDPGQPEPKPEPQTPPQPKTQSEQKTNPPAVVPTEPPVDQKSLEETKAKYVKEAQAEYQACLATPGKTCLEPDVSDAQALP